MAWLRQVLRRVSGAQSAWRARSEDYGKLKREGRIEGKLRSEEVGSIEGGERNLPLTTRYDRGFASARMRQGRKTRLWYVILRCRQERGRAVGGELARRDERGKGKKLGRM